MKDVQAFIDSLNLDEYKTMWSRFWIREVGYDPNQNGFSKIAFQLSVEEAQKKDKMLEEKFLNFIKTNYYK